MLTIPTPPAIVRYVGLPGSDIAERWLSLTPDEQTIVRMVSQGFLNKQIARQTHAALRTVEDRRSRAMRKIGADSITDLMRFVVRAEDLRLM